VEEVEYSQFSSWQMEYSEFVEALANGTYEVCRCFDSDSVVAKVLV